MRNKIFVFKNIPYLRVTPCKALFRSDTVHQVVTRGSFFAVNLQTNILTVLPQGADEIISIQQAFPVKEK